MDVRALFEGKRLLARTRVHVKTLPFIFTNLLLFLRHLKLGTLAAWALPDLRDSRRPDLPAALAGESRKGELHDRPSALAMASRIA